MKKVFVIFCMVLVAMGLLTACRRGTSSSSTPALPSPTATTRPPTATLPLPTATQLPPPTSTPEEAGLEKHKFTFVSPLGTQEESEPIENTLAGLPGIKEASVDEVSVTVKYDPKMITLEEVQKAIESLGYEVKR